MRGSYRELLRRVGVVEQLVAYVVPASPGCGTCATWPDYPVVEDNDCCPEVAGSSLLGLFGPPRGGWPEGFVCPGCGREPLDVFHIVYEDAPEGWETSRRPLAGVPYDRS